MKGITDATPRVLFYRISWSHKKGRIAHRTVAWSSSLLSLFYSSSPMGFLNSIIFTSSDRFNLKKNLEDNIYLFTTGKRGWPLRPGLFFFNSMRFPKYRQKTPYGLTSGKSESATASLVWHFLVQLISMVLQWSQGNTCKFSSLARRMDSMMRTMCSGCKPHRLNRNVGT